jgi:hypothetical protein
MGTQSDKPQNSAAVSAPRQEDDRRKHARVPYKGKARVLTSEGKELACLILNISAGGVMLKTKFAPKLGERLIVYIDELGRFEGDVVRSSTHVFAVDYRSRRAKSRRTADALTYAVNAPDGSLNRRASPRIRRHSATSVRLENGETINCSILDISLTGASVEIDPRPPLGAVVTIGKMTAKVVRRHDKGVGVVFTGPSAGIEEVIEKTSGSQNETLGDGPEFAAPFGKKSAPL